VLAVARHQSRCQRSTFGTRRSKPAAS
jgi:hypothetical protein